mmetsp:Transcript_41072/g.87475  ORF Transcript_41072/g.87475 Transcript_41072/m.87475 type:complete len:249 (+) Transcript_41072:63-809(+)
MVRRMPWLLGLVLGLLCAVDGQIPPDMQEAAVGKKKARLAKEEPYVRCDVCKVAVDRMWSQVEEKAKGVHRSKLGEIEIGETLETVCDPDDDAGEWMSSYDIVQAEISGPLTLVKQDSAGECFRECTTIAHICKAILDEHREDISQMLYEHYRPVDSARPSRSAPLTPDKFQSRVCKKLSKFCPGKAVPKGFKHRDERWMPIIDEEGYKMRKMQHVMNKAAKEQGGQPVQFMDPMGSGMFSTPGDDEL